MDVYEALYTTRAMRRCRPDKIPMDVQQRILDAAVRAPMSAASWRPRSASRVGFQPDAMPRSLSSLIA